MPPSPFYSDFSSAPPTLRTLTKIDPYAFCELIEIVEWATTWIVQQSHLTCQKTNEHRQSVSLSPCVTSSPSKLLRLMLIEGLSAQSGSLFHLRLSWHAPYHKRRSLILTPDLRRPIKLPNPTEFQHIYLIHLHEQDWLHSANLNSEMQLLIITPNRMRTSTEDSWRWMTLNITNLWCHTRKNDHKHIAERNLMLLEGISARHTKGHDHMANLIKNISKVWPVSPWGHAPKRAEVIFLRASSDFSHHCASDRICQ